MFDTYVVVDWSGASKPRTGADSIWLHCLGRRDGRLASLALDNPPTRQAAMVLLRQYLGQFSREGRRVFVGVDFPLGYPAGLAARLGLAGPPWRAVWDYLAERVTDDAENRNNRFAVAAELNAALGEQGFPFWGCPVGRETPRLGARRARPHGERDLPEKRVADRQISRLQPLWKLYGAGSVGSQALTGIPHIRALRDAPELAGLIKVWPFETGFARPGDETRIILAEIYPSMVEPDVLPGLPKDAGQVSALARHLAALDDEDLLALHFAPDPSLSVQDRRAAEREEGWVFALPRRTSLLRPQDYLRSAAAIYAESWKRVRAATDLALVPDELQGLAIRLVHTAGDPGVIDGLACSTGALAQARAALEQGAPILVDAEMVASGITRRFLTHDNQILCTLNDPRVPDLAQALGTTRSAAAIDLWRDRLEGAVVAIGNAPTALFRLLEIIDQHQCRPAVILGFPVGFVGAAESKQALMARGDVPWIALAGTRGGSALAAAAINALAHQEGEAAP